MGFEAAEARTAASVMRRLRNATATVAVPIAAAGQTFGVIFDNEYLFVDEAGVSSSAPAVEVLEADMPQAVRDALEAGGPVTLTIRTVSYSVVEPKSDGTGMSVLRLRK